MIRRSILAGFLALLLAGSVAAQDWAQKMFETTDHDFGVVARGAKTEFEFEITNPYVELIHIADVRSSCGCTTPSITKPWLKTHESGSILAHLNTDKFLGRKSATLTVTIDRPYRAQVQLHVRSDIRRDVVFTPGSVHLGAVECGKPAERLVTVTYSGRSDWRIREVQCVNPHIHVEAAEIVRRRGKVSYQLAVKTDGGLPPGMVNERIVLTTSSSSAPQVSVLVEGMVRAPLSVSPADLYLGTVPPGTKVTKQIVVRGKVPFRISAISCDSQNLEFVMPAEDEPKALHFVPITFTAGNTPGSIVETLRIETDQEQASPEVSVHAVVGS